MEHPVQRSRGSQSLGVVALGAALALACALSSPQAGAAPAPDGIEIITSPDRGQVRLDRPALLAIFMMRVRQWPDGTPVRVFVMPRQSPIHDRFAREELGTYPYVLSRTWDRIVFTGTGLAPEVVNSEQEMREKVLKTPGAIGYRSAGPESDSGAFRVAVAGPAGADHERP